MRLEWSANAIVDRWEIFDYLEQKVPQTAITMDERIVRQVEQLGDHPESGRIGRVTGTRELVIDRTPYIVAYGVVSGAVLILRVLHASRVWPDDFPG